MAGRRLRDAVKTVLSEAKKEFNGSVHVVIAGLTNTYSQYITTFEEYEVQRYEVSNIFCSSKIMQFNRLENTPNTQDSLRHMTICHTTRKSCNCRSG